MLFSCSILSDLNVTNSRLLGDCNSLTCCWDKTNLKEKNDPQNMSFNPRISLWDNIHNGFIQAGPGFLFSRTLLLIPDPYVECKRELISVSRPRHSGRCQVWGSSLPFLLVRSDGAPAAWLNAATPILAAPPHRAFLNFSLLTSHHTDKWINSVKMAEEIQPRAWKWLAFSLQWPPPILTPTLPPNKSHWLE